MNWTPERVITLKTLWSAGESASAIAAVLGGVTRNAVIGKVHRLSLPAHTINLTPRRPRAKRASPTALLYKLQNALTPPKPKRNAKSSIPPLEPALIDPPRLGQLKPGQCCWPEGDPRRTEFHFCGRASIPSQSYCPHHRARAYK